MFFGTFLLLPANDVHDVQSSYTGVYARGGPSTTCTSPQFDLAAYLDRSASPGGISCPSSSNGVAHKKAGNNIVKGTPWR
jgi:hypothetical protein